MVVLEERISGLNQEEDVLPRRNVEASFIKVRVAKRVCRQSVLSQHHKKREHASVLEISVPTLM